MKKRSLDQKSHKSNKKNTNHYKPEENEEQLVPYDDISHLIGWSNFKFHQVLEKLKRIKLIHKNSDDQHEEGKENELITERAKYLEEILQNAEKIEKIENCENIWKFYVYVLEEDFDNFDFCVASIRDDHLLAMKKIADLYYKGMNTEIDYSKAFKWFMKAAERGCFESQAQIGYMYFYGHSVPQDYSKALEWLLKAESHGKIPNLFSIQYDIGCIYYFGYGVEKDISTALEWYLKAAEQGDTMSQNICGKIYNLNGNYSIALKWYLRAAEKGDAKSQLTAGSMLTLGKGCTRDYSKGFELVLKSANQNESDAMALLGDMYFDGKVTNKDYSLAFKWYSKAAENGNLLAHLMLGLMYLKGKGVEQNDSKAFEYYLEAAKQGNSKAQLTVSQFYFKGQGTGQNYSEGLKWMGKNMDLSNRKSISNFLELFQEKLKYVRSPIIEKPNVKLFPFPFDNLMKLIHSYNEEEAVENIQIEENILIKLSERDSIECEGKLLKRSNYFRTLLSSDWIKNVERTKNGLMIVDLSGVSNEIIPSMKNEGIVEIFNLYFNYLKEGNTSFLRKKSFFELELLHELCIYLMDDLTIYEILEILNPIYIYYLMEKFERKEHEKFICGIVASFILKNLDSKLATLIPKHVVEIVLSSKLLPFECKKKLNDLIPQSNEISPIDSKLSVAVTNFNRDESDLPLVGKFHWKGRKYYAAIQDHLRYVKFTNERYDHLNPESKVESEVTCEAFLFIEDEKNYPVALLIDNVPMEDLIHWPSIIDDIHIMILYDV